MKPFFLKLKHHFIETKKTIAPFKWSIIFYLIFVGIFIADYFDPPAKDDPIFIYEYSKGAWNYINQETYLESYKMFLANLILIFFLGTSNIKNHPWIARGILLLPLILLGMGMIKIILTELN